MTQLLKTSPLEAMARRKVEQKGPSAVMTFPKNIGAHGTLMRFFKYSYGIHLQVAFDKYQNQPSDKLREHRLGEVLQGRSKSKLNII